MTDPFYDRSIRYWVGALRKVVGRNPRDEVPEQTFITAEFFARFTAGLEDICGGLSNVFNSANSATS